MDRDSKHQSARSGEAGFGSVAEAELDQVDSQSESQSGLFWRVTKQLCQLLIKPFSNIEDAIKSRKSQLLAGLLLAVIFLQIVSLASAPGTDGTIAVYFKIAIMLNVLAYLLSRTSVYQAGALLWAISTSTTTFFSISDGSQPGNPETGLFFLAFSMMVPALVVGRIIIATIGIFNVAGVAMFAAGFVELSGAYDFSQAIIFNIAATIIILGIISYRNYLENIRQHQLLESETNLKGLAESTKDGFLVNQGGKHVFTNKSMAVMLGYDDADELIGTSMDDVVHPDELEKVQSRYRSRSRGEEQPAQYETLFKMKSGAPIPVEINATMTTWRGRAAGMVSVRDITDRKTAESKLLEEERNLVLAQSIAKVGSWVWNIETMKFIWSDEMHQIFDVGKDEFTGDIDVIERAVHPDDRHLLVEAQEHVAKTGEPQPLEYRIVRKDGGITTVWAEGEVIKNNDGDVVRMVGTVQDISERKEAEKALELSEKKFRDLADNAPIMIGVTDETGHITFLNKTWLDFRGKTLEEEEGWAWVAGLHPEDRERVVSETETCISQKKPYSIEYRIEDRDGVYHWMLDTAVPLLDVNGVAMGYIGTAINISDHKNIENELKESEALLEKAQEIAEIGHWKLCLETNTVEGSRELFKIFDLTPEEATLDAFVEVVHPDDREMDVAAIQRGAETGESWDIEHRLICRDGKEKWVRAIGEAEKDQGGNIFQLIGTVQDITELKAAESATSESERLLREAQHIAHMGYLDWNPLTNEITWSEETYRIYGFPLDFKPTLETTVELVHPDDTKRVGAALNSTIKDKKEYNVEHRVIRPDGNVIYVHAKGELTINKNGEVVRMLGTIVDITERKEVEEALRISEERYELAAAGTNDGLWDWNLVTDYCYLSPRFLELIGSPEDDDIPEKFEKFRALIHPDDLGHVEKAIARHFEQNEDFDVEYRTLMKHRGYRWFRSRGQAVRDKNNTPIRMTGSITDIDDRKNTETELAQHREHLEELVEARTEELRTAQAELLRKEKLATLGQLTATVSHELRNPLGAMRPSMYIIKKRADKNDEKLQQAIERVDRNVSRCDQIIDELLDFTRSTNIETKSINVDAWLGATLSDIDLPKGIELHYHPGLGKLELDIDTNRMRRALINIIDNACQAMTSEDNPNQGAESATLTVTTHVGDGRAEIEVSDTGPGIPENVLPKIFEPLYSTKTFGVGLGMATIRQIARQHGGDVEIKVTNSKGTTVGIWLPQIIQ